MTLKKPLDYCYITQPWGVDWVGNDFYKKLGYKGHNGIDFRARNGTPFYAVFDGIIDRIFKTELGGNDLRLRSDDGNWEAVYIHWQEVSNIKEKTQVKAGQELGKTDTTGKYCFGAHLHFGLKPLPLKNDNGYAGAIDPYPYFEANFDKLPVDVRYNKQRNWWNEWRIRFKNSWIHRQLISKGRHPLSLTNQEVSALVYGSWDWHIVMDAAWFPIWSQLTKGEWQAGKQPPILLSI